MAKHDPVVLAWIAGECGVPVATVRVWASRGKIGSRPGRIDAEKVLELINLRRVTCASLIKV